MKKFPHLPAALLALATLLAFAAPARATTIIAPTFPELVAEADTICRGRVTATVSRRADNATGPLIKTYVTFAIDRTLKGAPRTEIVLEFLGGTVGELELDVAGQPHFALGDREILFIQKNGTQLCPLARMMHGRYRVLTDAATRRDYIARDNRRPLTDVSEVGLPPAASAALPPAALSAALPPEIFEQRITAQHLANLAAATQAR